MASLGSTTVMACTLVLAITVGCGDDTGSGGTGGTSSNGGNGNGGTPQGGAPSNGGGGATSEGGAGGAAACLDFGTDCTPNDICCDVAGATGECYAFGMGSQCTIPCPADPADCPNNGAGCNNMDPAVCKTM